MEGLAEQLGYAGLFALAFLSATLLPLASEAAVAGAPALGLDPWAVLVVATAGNTLGACLNYWIGRRGARAVRARRGRADDRLERARRLFARWGTPLLFFSWLPVVGDPLTLVAGAAGAPFRSFALWVLAGKAARYAVVLGAARAILGSP